MPVRHAGGVEVVAHIDAAEFARLARPLLEPDPVRHTTVLTVLDAVRGGTFAPVTMLTVHDGRAVVGAVLRTEDRPALVSGLPPRCAAATVDALLRLELDPGGALGPVAVSAPRARIPRPCTPRPPRADRARCARRG